MPDIETSLTYCNFCPKLCRHTCPVSNETAIETLVPQNKMAQMQRLRRGDVERDELNTVPLYGCLGCGACTAFCLHGNEVGPILFRGRDEAEREGRGHPKLHDLPQRFRAHSEKQGAAVAASVSEAERPP